MDFYIISKIFESAICNIKLLFLRIIHRANFTFDLPFIGQKSPTIKIRNAGKVRLGKIKTRAGLMIFADGGAVMIEDKVFFNNYCSINSMVCISIGAGTIFGEGVKLYDHDHSFSSDTGVESMKFVCAPISIGRNCWLGSNVVVLKGVSICDNVLVAAGSVVRKSITEPGVYCSKVSANLDKIG